MAAKEIWYVWDGESPIPSGVKLYIDRKGRFSEPRFTLVLFHKGWGALYEIVAYTLGETRERVECETCAASRFRGSIYCGGYFEYRDCPDCHGRGYIWKLGEAQL